jgi:hypothetical protein
MLCLALALQLEIVHLRKISKVRIDCGSGGRNCGQNGSSALEGEMHVQKKKRALTASLEEPSTL